MLPKKDKKSPQPTYSSSSMLVEGAIITGDMSSKTDIRIDGILEGNLKCETKVVVGKNGTVIGNIFCSSILVEGKVDGNIEAKDKTHLLASAVLLGGLSTNKLIIEDGAMFNNVAMMGKPMPVIDYKKQDFSKDFSHEEKSKDSSKDEIENDSSKNAPNTEKRNNKKQKTD